jgi:hypothetical protein
MRPIIFALPLWIMASPSFAQDGSSGQAIEARVLGEFHNRVLTYLAVNASSRTTPDEEILEDNTLPDELCSLPDLSIQGDSLRPGHGRIFTPELDDLFRRLVASILSPIDQAGVLRVMPLFPGGVPVHVISPDLFRVLPDLPDRLEYRFLEHDLVIVDLYTRVIVDSVWLVVGPSAT